ncbi:MAG: hypothetical protein C4547_12555 [Phycisphaerales bacterium]|nr:MAG: hypothetical protein C4547_12555 [Phycisphaerales bacterium]
MVAFGSGVSPAPGSPEKENNVRVSFTCILAALVTVCAAAPVRADIYALPAQYKVHIAQDTNGYAMSNAGEFTITNISLPGNVLFGLASDKSGDSLQTFCVEYQEHIAPPREYWADITTYATGGGGSPDGNKGPGGSPSDDLEPETAYLYTLFRNGSLFTAGYESTPSPDRENDARALQIAIWLLEGERSEAQLVGETNLAQGKAWRNQAVAAVDNGDWTGLGNVRVLNLWGDRDRKNWRNEWFFKQDQLIMIPSPGAAILAVMGMGLFGFTRRRPA